MKTCKIKDCTNTSEQGEFVGKMCRPCYLHEKFGVGRHSQAYRNAVEEEKNKTPVYFKDGIKK